MSFESTALEMQELQHAPANAPGLELCDTAAAVDVVPAHPTLATPLPVWPSSTLLREGAEAHIRHGDALYRLRLTRQGKLILTK